MSKRRISPACRSWFRKWDETTERVYPRVELQCTPEYDSNTTYKYFLRINSGECGLFVEKRSALLTSIDIKSPRYRQKIGKNPSAYPLGAVSIPVRFDSAADEHTVGHRTFEGKFEAGETLVPIGYDHISERRACSFLDAVDQTLQSDKTIYQGLLSDGVLTEGRVVSNWFYQLVYFGMLAQREPEDFISDVRHLNDSWIENSWRYVSPSAAAQVYDIAQSIELNRLRRKL